MHSKIVFFQAAFLVSIFLHFMLIFMKNDDLGTPIREPLGPKWHPKSPKWHQNVGQNLIAHPHFGGTETELLPGSFLERSWAQSWSIWLDFGCISDAMFMEFGIMLGNFLLHFASQVSPKLLREKTSRTSRDLQKHANTYCQLKYGRSLAISKLPSAAPKRRITKTGGGGTRAAWRTLLCSTI